MLDEVLLLCKSLQDVQPKSCTSEAPIPFPSQYSLGGTEAHRHQYTTLDYVLYYKIDSNRICLHLYNTVIVL